MFDCTGSELILIDIKKPFGRVSVSCDITGPYPAVPFQPVHARLSLSSWSIPAEVYEPPNRHRNAACTQQSQPDLLDLPILLSPLGLLLVYVLSSVRETYQFTVHAVITVVDDILPPTSVGHRFCYWLLTQRSGW
jgi:hypothetical protein